MVYSNGLGGHGIAAQSKDTHITNEIMYNDLMIHILQIESIGDDVVEIRHSGRLEIVGQGDFELTILDTNC